MSDTPKSSPKPIIQVREDQVFRDATQDALNKKYLNDVGHNAIVQREKLANDRTDALKEVLKDMGRDFAETGVVPKGMEYVGSMAVHIYRAPTLGHVAHVNQLALNECPEALAGPAVSDLRGAALEHYSHRRQKKRTGF